MFVGREKEIKILEKRVKSKGFEFGLVYGRRIA
jgi:AAA+ ATPase superfamily predicted ATPase